MSIWVKDPLDTVWFTFNWGGDPTTNPPSPSFLASGETITAHTTTVDSNLTKLSDTATSTTVSVQVTGGVNSTQSLVSCNIHTSAGNIYETEKFIFIVTRGPLP